MPLNWTRQLKLLYYLIKENRPSVYQVGNMNVFQIAWSLQLFMDHVPSNPKLEDALMMWTEKMWYFLQLSDFWLNIHEFGYCFDRLKHFINLSIISKLNFVQNITIAAAIISLIFWKMTNEKEKHVKFWKTVRKKSLKIGIVNFKVTQNRMFF